MPRSPVSEGKGQGMGQERTGKMGLERGQGVGFYGKLPCVGDFVSRRLPTEFIRPWDLWLQESLAGSQARLGESWLANYLTSPLWRFVLTPGIAGQTPWCGVLMPSVDRVGRYFPLTLACPLAAGVNPLRLLSETGWFQQLEEVVLSGLDEANSLPGFDALVQALGEPTTKPIPSRLPGGGGKTRTNAWRVPADSPTVLDGHCSMLLSLALEQVFCAFSLWWTNGSERVPPSGLICQGLPPTDGFSAMLAGDWGDAGWWDLAIQPPSGATG